MRSEEIQLDRHLQKEETWDQAQEWANRLLPEVRWGRLTECLSNELQEKLNGLSEEIETELAVKICEDDTSFLD